MFSKVVDEIKALKVAQEDGWVPKLKEVRIIRGRTHLMWRIYSSEEVKEMLRNLRNAAGVPVREENLVRREFLGELNSPEELVVHIV